MTQVSDEELEYIRGLGEVFELLLCGEASDISVSALCLSLMKLCKKNDLSLDEFDDVIFSMRSIYGKYYANSEDLSSLNNL